jgi:hypothetical protein
VLADDTVDPVDPAETVEPPVVLADDTVEAVDPAETY